MPNLYYHTRMLSYFFGPSHPFDPERWRRTMSLLGAFGIEPTDPGPGLPEDVQRVHSEVFIEGVKNVTALDEAELWTFGFGSDTPPFEGMYEAALACVAGTAQAARDVRDGANMAIAICGGLHHAKRENASGFCVFDDCAVALHILRERFSRVAYVDIDVHHGDGVQSIFYEDPTVLTCSIHQDGRTLYPGSGFVGETGVELSSLNVPLAPHTSGDVWLWAFRSGILPVLKRFSPEAIVLQMGADSHFLDPLASIENTVQEWLAAVVDVMSLGLPLVALGGGGYNMGSVVRMWTAGCLTLCGRNVPERLPPPFAEEWSVSTFSDFGALSRGAGKGQAEKVIAAIGELFP